MKKWIAITALSAMVSVNCAANWQVTSTDSRVSFVSVKKGEIGEVHHFKQLEGTLNDKGEFELKIPLASVSTGIEIRDERMQTLLFDVAQFPTLSLMAQVDAKAVDALAVGDTKQFDIDGKISLHGKEQSKTFSVLVAKLSDKKLFVSSLQPVVVNANEFALTAGIDKLREIAGLTSISTAVPVSFVLTLAQ